jgi:programmed cell death 6-interacting protein
MNKSKAKSVLLAIHVKRTDDLEIKGPILSYIRETYGDRDAEDCVDDLASVQSLRKELVLSQTASQLSAKDTYIKCVLGASMLHG